MNDLQLRLYRLLSSLNTDKTPSGVIRPELLIRWSNWNLKALETEVKKNFLEKYKSIMELEAQKLNPEFNHLLSESVIKLDSYFINSHNLLGLALIALGMPVSTLLSNKALDRSFLLSTLYDIRKILTELHNSQLL